MAPETTSILIIYLSVALALLWAFIQAIIVVNLKLTESNSNPYERYDEGEKNNLIDSDKIATIKYIGEKISEGASAFLF